MRKITLALAVCSVALFAGKNVAPVDTKPIDVPSSVPTPSEISNGFALKLGTLGIGVDYEHFFNDKFAMRLNVNGLKYTKSKTIKDIPFKAKLTLLSAGILADYHPWASTFRVSGGVYYNGNKLDVTAKQNTNITINGNTYNAGTTTITGKIDFKKVAPYLGIGWSSTEVNGWHFTADIGALYQGKAKVSLSGETTNATLQTRLDNDLNDKQKEIYDKFKKYKFYPVISIGIEKKF